jgi:hypothetical protein
MQPKLFDALVFTNGIGKPGQLLTTEKKRLKLDVVVTAGLQYLKSIEAFCSDIFLMSSMSLAVLADF